MTLHLYSNLPNSPHPRAAILIEPRGRTIFVSRDGFRFSKTAISPFLKDDRESPGNEVVNKLSIHIWSKQSLLLFLLASLSLYGTALNYPYVNEYAVFTRLKVPAEL